MKNNSILTSCSFSGHRPQSLYKANSENEVICSITKAVEDAVCDGYTDFYCGGCIGGDFIFADAVILMRNRYPDKLIKLHMCLPCRDQAELWCRADRDRYSGYLQVADSVVCLNDNYSEGCMQQRSRYMIDRSSLLILAYNGTKGGTDYAYRYAKKRGLRINNVIGILNEAGDQLSFL